MSKQIRKGLPKLEDFPDHKRFKMRKFWDFYDKDKSFKGSESLEKNLKSNLHNWNSVKNSKLKQPFEQVFAQKHGIYVLSDTHIRDEENPITLTRGRLKIPIDNVIYVGQAGAESDEDGSSFHERIFKHALVAVGIHDGGWGDTPKVKHSGMADSEYWRDYREKRKLSWEDKRLPINDWWVSLISMNSRSPEEKEMIKRLEDILMLGVSALRRPDRKNLNNAFSLTLPFCNKQFGFGVLDEVFDQPWSMTTGKKKCRVN